MHLVHFNGKYNSIGEAANKTEGLAVLGVFVEVLLLLLILLRPWRPKEQHTFSIHAMRIVGMYNKKLSYRRGTARRAMLVNSCYVSRSMGIRKVSNNKSDLQCHSRALAMVPFDRAYMRFPISLPMQPCLYLTPIPRYYHLFTKI